MDASGVTVARQSLELENLGESSSKLAKTTDNRITKLSAKAASDQTRLNGISSGPAA